VHTIQKLLFAISYLFKPLLQQVKMSAAAVQSRSMIQKLRAARANALAALTAAAETATTTAKVAAKAVTQAAKPQLLTEDTGKIFERAICLLYNIPYDGKYKYSLADAETLCERLRPMESKLRELLPAPRHSAKAGGRYDFSSPVAAGGGGGGPADILPARHLSAKTTKGDGKVCPQVIGQPTKKRFCEFFELPADSSNEDIKAYIQENVNNVLYAYMEYTFDCPTLYYNAKTNKLSLIEQLEPIDWSEYDLQFTRQGADWNESSSVQVRLGEGVWMTIGEFQVHNHRSAIKFRWAFETILRLFGKHFRVVEA